MKASYTKCKTWVLGFPKFSRLFLAESKRPINKCLPTARSDQQRKSAGKRKSNQESELSLGLHMGQHVHTQIHTRAHTHAHMYARSHAQGERKGKATTLPEFSETDLWLFQTTQELLEVQLRKENVFTSQDHQTLALFLALCVHRGSQIILLSCGSKCHSADQHSSLFS